MLSISSKLPNVGTTIFSVMSALANEHNAINLSQGFPNFDAPERLKERIDYHLRNGKNQYAPMPGVPYLREVLANKMNTAYGCNLDFNTEITITAGATQALFTAIATFVRQGEEVIIIEPAYDSYRPAIELIGGVAVPYALKAPDYRIDWKELERLICAKTRMIIINTPHNPVGKTLKEQDLKKLEKLVVGKNIMVLSDEVYEHLIYDGQRHESVLRYPDLFQQSMAVYSFGKSLHSTGWKMGYCVAAAYLMSEFRKVHQYNVFSANSFVQYGIADFLKDPNFYLGLPGFYQQKRDLFNRMMQGSRLKPLGTEGTYFQLYDYASISNEKDTDFAIRMTKEYGVAAIPVSVFYSNQQQEQVIRLCFAKTDDLLEQAGGLLQKI